MAAEESDHVEFATRTGPPWKLVALVVTAAALLTFFFQNGQDVQVDFLWLDVTWPLWSVIGVSVILGVVVDRLALWQWRRARAR